MKIWKSTLALAGAAALTFGVACKKPEPMKAPEPAKAPVVQDTSAADAEAKRRAEEEARRKAEAEAQQKAEAARRSAEAFRKAAEQALQDIHFDLDKAVVKEKDRILLQGIADFMKRYPQAKVQVEGNADERGTLEYNLALGSQRALAAIAYLKVLGISEGRFNSISYGKEKPVCTESSEDCWHRNRRDHFVLKN
ncbi:MAG TPA: OmpA family protein [Geothrix sp.]|nr:OmpA family protein [Geothrix sp.]